MQAKYASENGGTPRLCSGTYSLRLRASGGGGVQITFCSSSITRRHDSGCDGLAGVHAAPRRLPAFSAALWRNGIRMRWLPAGVRQRKEHISSTFSLRDEEMTEKCGASVSRFIVMVLCFKITDWRQGSEKQVLFCRLSQTSSRLLLLYTLFILFLLSNCSHHSFYNFFLFLWVTAVFTSLCLSINQ